MSESVVLCEGYYDRAFWAGWLTHLGCVDLSLAPGLPGRFRVSDPWGTPVGRGQYAYRSVSGHFLRVVPCQSKSNVRREAEDRLKDRSSRVLIRLVLCIDADTPAGVASGGATGMRQQDLEHFLRSQFDPSATLNADGEFEIDNGVTRVSLFRWEVADPSSPGLPVQQSLERLVCCALAAAYPARAKPVQDWLDSRPQPPPANPKEHTWSYLAGWYADRSSEGFYTSLWTDPRVAVELKNRLQSAGAWQIAAAMAS